MTVWIVCFVVLFALAELFNWVKQFTLPLPVAILAGAVLAVASNYDKIVGSYLGHQNINNPTVETPKLQAPTPSNQISFSATNSIPETQSLEIE